MFKLLVRFSFNAPSCVSRPRTGRCREKNKNKRAYSLHVTVLGSLPVTFRWATSLTN